VRAAYGVLHLILQPCVDGDGSVSSSCPFGTSLTQDLLRPFNTSSHTPCRNPTITGVMRPFCSKNELTLKVPSVCCVRGPVKLIVRTQVHHLNHTTSARMLEGPSNSFRTSTTSTIPSLMYLAGRPGKIMEDCQYWNPTITKVHE
jgi:hypothetical protein